MNRHSIRKCPYGPEGRYEVVYHSALEISHLFNGTKDQCKVWLKEQIKLLKASK